MPRKLLFANRSKLFRFFCCLLLCCVFKATPVIKKLHYETVTSSIIKCTKTIISTLWVTMITCFGKKWLIAPRITYIIKQTTFRRSKDDCVLGEAIETNHSFSSKCLRFNLQIFKIISSLLNVLFEKLGIDKPPIYCSLLHGEN